MGGVSDALDFYKQKPTLIGEEFHLLCSDYIEINP